MDFVSVKHSQIESLDYHPEWLWILFPENYHDDVTGDAKRVVDFVSRNHRR